MWNFCRAYKAVYIMQHIASSPVLFSVCLFEKWTKCYRFLTCLYSSNWRRISNMPRLLHLWLLHTPSISVKMWYVFLWPKAFPLKWTDSSSNSSFLMEQYIKTMLRLISGHVIIFFQIGGSIFKKIISQKVLLLAP